MGLISRKLLEQKPQEIGKIKLGGRGRQKKTSGGGKMFMPEKYDHFEVVSRTRRDGDGAFERDHAVHAIVGDKPTGLEGFLMFPEIEQNLHTTMAHYAGRKPKILCDGEVKTENGVEGPCTRETTGCPCKPYGRLQLQLTASPYTGGYHVFRTRSWESVNNIQTALEEIYARFGSLFMAPVKLICYESEDQYTSGGKDLVGRSYKVALVLNMDLQSAAQFMVDKKERLENIRARLMLTAGEVQRDLEETDLIEAGDIQDEFQPPQELEVSVATQEKLDEVADNLPPVEDAEIVPDEEEEDEVPGGGPEDVEKPQEPARPVPAARETEPDLFSGEEDDTASHLRALIDTAVGQGLLKARQLQRCHEALEGTEELQKQVIEWLELKLKEATDGTD